MRGSRMFCRSYKSRKFYPRYKWAIIGPPAKRHGRPMMLRIQTSIVKKPYIFCAFSGEGGSRPPVPPPLDPHILILAGSMRETCLRGSSFDHFRPCQIQTAQIDVQKSLAFNYNFQESEDQTSQMCRPVCAFVVRM